VILSNHRQNNMTLCRFSKLKWRIQLQNCGGVVAQPIGRRHSLTRVIPQNMAYCGKCCDNYENCNRDLCTAGGVYFIFDESSSLSPNILFIQL